jgi:hypothetical protein
LFPLDAEDVNNYIFPAHLFIPQLTTSSYAIPAVAIHPEVSPSMKRPLESPVNSLLIPTQPVSKKNRLETTQKAENPIIDNEDPYLSFNTDTQNINFYSHNNDATSVGLEPGGTADNDVFYSDTQPTTTTTSRLGEGGGIEEDDFSQRLWQVLMDPEGSLKVGETSNVGGGAAVEEVGATTTMSAEALLFGEELENSLTNKWPQQPMGGDSSGNAGLANVQNGPLQQSSSSISNNNSGSASDFTSPPSSNTNGILERSPRLAAGVQCTTETFGVVLVDDDGNYDNHHQPIKIGSSGGQAQGGNLLRIDLGGSDSDSDVEIKNSKDTNLQKEKEKGKEKEMEIEKEKDKGKEKVQSRRTQSTRRRNGSSSSSSSSGNHSFVTSNTEVVVLD